MPKTEARDLVLHLALGRRDADAIHVSVHGVEEQQQD